MARLRVASALVLVTVSLLSACEAAPPPTVQGMIEARWAGTGHDARAVRIARCESGLNPQAKNKRSSASGVFQIVSRTWRAHADADMNVFNAHDNIEVAYRIWLSDGRSFRQWRCRG